uniref:Protein NYNRIN-like n=1 Tax=Tanacetum cinerariifolium TaxID=118510 RepID=A0A6L2LE11_TANCI|nr:protein NYNRIN-like [Tanacetum cinerariifolium]
MIEVVSSKEKMMNSREAMEEWMNTPITFPPVPSDDVSDEPLIVEAEVESPTIKSRLKATQTDLVGFSGEITKPVGKIKLDVCFRNEGLCRRTTMKFTIIRAPSPYNIILGRMRHKTLRAIPSTIHSMIKFPTPKGIATLITQSVILSECEWLEKKRVVEEPVEENPLDWKYVTTEKVMVNPAFSEQLVVIGGGLSKNTFPLEKSEVVLKEVNKGIKAGIIRPVRNLEAYANDMVIQSNDEKGLLADIAKTFNNLKKINMKLNMKKCSFGVEEGKFLGYMITSKGIQMNPKKTKVLVDLQSPRTLKEMQSLSRKLVALNRFLAKSIDRSLPFFNTLRNITKENKHEYKWTHKAEEAFQQIKKLILSLLFLTPTFPKETMYAYLDVSIEVVSVVLMTDRKGRQCPVHYMSRNLNEAQKNYASIEKLALSLIHMTRRLRRYFEAHSSREYYRKIKMNHAIYKQKLDNIQLRKGTLQEGILSANVKGMDIIGPIPQDVRRVKFIIVAVEYFTKWIEAKPLAKIIAHPQANGLVESANKSLMEGIKTQLGRERARWVEELPNVLRAHRTSIKQSNGETPFSLTYISEAVIPAEIGMSTYHTMMIREEFNKEEMRLNLDLL